MRELMFVGLLSLSTAASSCQPAAETTLAVLNSLRVEARQCGARLLPAAQPLRWSPRLADSAARFAQELARLDRIDHAGAAARSLRSRLREAGYAMRVAAENLAGGPDTFDEAMVQWLASPEHCENLMLADVHEVGLACVSGPGRLQRYWVLHLAAPAPARSSPDRSP